MLHHHAIHGINHDSMVTMDRMGIITVTDNKGAVQQLRNAHTGGWGAKRCVTRHSRSQHNVKKRYEGGRVKNLSKMRCVIVEQPQSDITIGHVGISMSCEDCLDVMLYL